MADLSTLDATAPADIDPASQGASQIRTERADLLGWAGVEHALTGPHKFLVGGVALRPAPGNVGRIYINTDSGQIEYDNGSAWVASGSQQAVKAYAFSISSIGLTASFVDIISASITTLTGQWIQALAYCFVTGSAADFIGASFRVLLDGVQINPGVISIRIPVFNGTMIVPMTLPALNTTPTAGAHTLKFQGRTTNGLIATTQNQLILTAF